MDACLRSARGWLVPTPGDHLGEGVVVLAAGRRLGRAQAGGLEAAVAGYGHPQPFGPVAAAAADQADAEVLPQRLLALETEGGIDVSKESGGAHDFDPRQGFEALDVRVAAGQPGQLAAELGKR